MKKVDVLSRVLARGRETAIRSLARRPRGRHHPGRHAHAAQRLPPEAAAASDLATEENRRHREMVCYTGPMTRSRRRLRRRPRRRRLVLREAPVPPVLTARLRLHWRRASTACSRARSRRPRFIYGVMETEITNYCSGGARRRQDWRQPAPAARVPPDNVVLPAPFLPDAALRPPAVVHGHFKVNGKKVDIPSYQVAAHDVTGRPRESLETTPVHRGCETHGERVVLASGSGGDPVADASWCTSSCSPGADRCPGPGAAHRRVLPEE